MCIVVSVAATAVRVVFDERWLPIVYCCQCRSYERRRPNVIYSVLHNFRPNQISRRREKKKNVII